MLRLVSKTNVRCFSLSSSKHFFFKNLLNHFQHSQKAKKALLERGIDLSRLTPEQELKLKPVLRLRSAFRVVNVVMGLMGVTALLVWSAKRSKNINQSKQIEEDYRPVWVNLKDFQHKGALIKKYLLPEQIVVKLKDLEEIEFRPEDSICVSFPKSGTTWIQELIFLLQTNFDFQSAKSQDLSQRYSFLEWPSVHLPQLQQIKGKRFFKTHLPPQFFNSSFQKAKVSFLLLLR